MTRIDDVAKLFWTGRSQAVRLPKAYRFDGKEVRISREGNRVILQAVEEDGWAWIRRLRKFDDDAAAAALDRPGPETMPDGPSFDN
ncbi:antitoxin [uncultured Sphingomonas sp.]|uniref:antitoxin n=1 Tax=uncultured Sphingomonas sp. TaxID=158754 RepID=UPI0035CAF27C